MSRPGPRKSRSRIRKTSMTTTPVPVSNPRFANTTPEQDERAELIARVRLQIAAGVYETEEKLEAALMAMFGQFDD